MRNRADRQSRKQYHRRNDNFHQGKTALIPDKGGFKTDHYGQGNHLTARRDCFQLSGYRADSTDDTVSGGDLKIRVHLP